MRWVLFACVLAIAGAICRPVRGMDIALRLGMWDDGVESAGGQTQLELPELDTRVPLGWIEQYPQLSVQSGGDAATALRLPTGKHGAMGEPLFVWHDFLAGTNPLKGDDMLMAFIAMREDTPEITWSPDLNTNGVVRVYRVWGKTNLVDKAWMCPTNSGHRFFKVTVEMP